MTMTSKERARAALLRGTPDKVPLGDFSIAYDTAERVLGHETYARAKAKCQIAYWEGRRDEVVQSLAGDTVALYNKLHVYDLVNLCAVMPGLYLPAGQSCPLAASRSSISPRVGMARMVPRRVTATAPAALAKGAAASGPK